MKDKIKDNPLKYGIILIFTVYEVIQAACLQFIGDDFIWCMTQHISDIFGETSITNPNGRYVTNGITFLMIHYPAFRFIIHIAVMLLLFREIALIFDRIKKTDGWINWTFSAVLLLTVPGRIVQYTITWISGFTNYVFSALLLLIYLRFCMQFLLGKGIQKFQKRESSLLFLGFLSTLCIEHVTIYLLMLAVLMIILSVIRFKKAYVGHILYLIGGIAGTVLMFSNANYHSVASGSDEIGIRFEEFSFVEVIMKVYDKIIVFYAKPFFIPHLLIAVSLLYLFLKKYASVKAIPKYAGICMGIILLFAGYSVFTQNFIDLQVISTRYTIRALETVFVFLYLVSIIYLSFYIFSKSKFMLICLFLGSTVMLTAPFVVVNPVTERCFFTEYLFWGLTAGLMIIHCAGEQNALQKKTIRIFISSGILVFSCLMAVMHITNKYCDVIRIRYLKEQLAEEKSNSVIVIHLPYPELIGDAMNNFEIDADNSEKLSYRDMMIQYYELDPRIREKKILFTDWYHYNLESAVE